MLFPIFALAAAVSVDPPAKVRAAIQEAVGKELNDPFSAQYDWQPVKSPVVYCGFVNAKNAFGAYVGYKPFMVLYSSDYQGTSVHSVEFSAVVVNKMCPEDGYRISR